MSRFPSPGLADRIEDEVQELEDGFERLGGQDSPFLLKGGAEVVERAQQIHSEREPSERERDEESNEPITRSIEEWQENLEELDFPFVDTISLEEHVQRANQIAELAVDEGFVDWIEREIDFDDDDVRGKYWPGVNLVEMSIDSDEFPGYKTGVVLAHELGHAFYDSWSPESGIEEQSSLFRTTEQKDQALGLSERLHGPVLETDGPIVDYRLADDEELAAAVFASRILEPRAAQRIAPDAVRRMEDVFGELSDHLF